LHPTPLRGPKIGGILESGFVLTLVPIYHGGAGEAQYVGPPYRWPFHLIALKIE
jgi:hypothetical protein